MNMVCKTACSSWFKSREMALETGHKLMRKFMLFVLLVCNFTGQLLKVGYWVYKILKHTFRLCSVHCWNGSKDSWLYLIATSFFACIWGGRVRLHFSNLVFLLVSVFLERIVLEAYKIYIQYTQILDIKLHTYNFIMFYCNADSH